MPPELVPTSTTSLQVLVEQQLGDLVGMGLGGDAGAHLVLALGAAVEARGIDRVPRRAQPVRYLCQIQPP